MSTAFGAPSKPRTKRGVLISDRTPAGLVCGSGTLEGYKFWTDREHLDIVYVCSNADIARQNIQRLNFDPSDPAAVVMPDRITLLPLHLAEARKHRVRFIPLTPGTSLNTRSKQGRAIERALLLVLLARTWDIDDGAFELLRGRAGTSGFFREVKRLLGDGQIDATLARGFTRKLGELVDHQSALGQQTIETRFNELASEFAETQSEFVGREINRRRNQLIGQLRELLAETCLDALEPVLVILDEFQRYKQLLDPSNSASRLAQRLFGTAENSTATRILLLSATPYKMLNVAGESGSNHYDDFWQTLRFLMPDESEQFREALEDYRRELMRLRHGDLGAILATKLRLEEWLGRAMVRTERLAVSADRSGMLREVDTRKTVLEKTEVEAYVALSRVASSLGERDPIEYWKAATYALSLMEDYSLKKKLREGIRSRRQPKGLVDAARLSDGLFLSRRDVESFRAIDPKNARLRFLMDDIIASDAWKLLWLPPSLPYYHLSDPFKRAAQYGLSKRLIFSCWRLAPKAISALVSYEVERRLMDATAGRRGGRRRRFRSNHGLLRWQMKKRQPTSMAMLTLLYPSPVLARLGDPLSDQSLRAAEIPTAATALKRIERRLQTRISAITTSAPADGPVDRNWYWAAPILLDLAVDRAGTQQWIDGWDPGANDRIAAERPAAHAHIAQVRRLVHGHYPLGRVPKDLARVLALIALGSPAVAALRTLGRVSSELTATRTVGRDCAAQVAWGMRAMFNRPDATALVKLCYPRKSFPHWQRVLHYCVGGGLQPTFDEYAHILKEAPETAARPPALMAHAIANGIAAALELGASRLAAEEYTISSGRLRQGARLSFRSRFALRFGESVEDEEDEGAQSGSGGSHIQRPERVLKAFNSPFWPFVLATTSAGKEGLDFHQYCHTVVHWNLPSNPVDLEQREGRIHRYKNHAVRKNVAQDIGLSAVLDETGRADVWDSLFQIAERRRDAQTSELEPFWVYTRGRARIERVVPLLPWSRDESRYVDLLDSLALYRLVLGQPDQEVLIQSLLARFPRKEIGELAQQLRMNLSPTPVSTLVHVGGRPCCDGSEYLAQTAHPLRAGDVGRLTLVVSAGGDAIDDFAADAPGLESRRSAHVASSQR